MPKFALISAILLAAATLRASTVADITFTGWATGDYNCMGDNPGACEHISNPLPFILEVIAPTTTLLDYSHEKGITGGRLEFGDIDEALYAPPPNPDNPHPDVTTPDTGDDGFTLFDSGGPHWMLSFRSDQLAGYGYDAPITINNMNVVPNFGGDYYHLMPLHDGYIIFDSFSDVDMSVVIDHEPDIVPEPSTLALLALGGALFGFALLRTTAASNQ